MTDSGEPDLSQLPTLDPETVEDLYERAPCGYLVTTLDGTIVRVNGTLLSWIGSTRGELVGHRRFADLLAAGGRIFYETHMAPLLDLQGEVQELAFDLTKADGNVLPVLVSALRIEADDQSPAHNRITVFDATHRHRYETELLRARKAAEASEQRARSVAETLQASLLSGGLSAGPGFRIETRYQPALEGLDVGGDWNDSFLLEDGTTLAISIGDVVGRGIVAACAMGQLRSALRAIAGSGLGPAATLEQLDAFAARIPDARLATVAYAEVDTTTGAMRYACAGHLPPLLVTSDGRAGYLWEGRSLPIGAVTRKRPEATTTLEPGSRIVLYTDGLIERRTRDIDEGFDALARVAPELAAAPLSTMADRLMADLLADMDNPDDVCILCLETSSR